MIPRIIVNVCRVYSINNATMIITAGNNILVKEGTSIDVKLEGCRVHGAWASMIRHRSK